jgi:type VI protein secretion system component Hcp
MPGDDSTDLLMMLVNLDDSPLETDCQTVFQTATPTAGALTRPKNTLLTDFKPATASARANFFEIQDVDLGFDIRPVDPSATEKKYGLDMGEATVERMIDRASPMLLKAVFETSPFQSAAIVKRRTAGTDVSGEPYMRMDFTGVLLTKVSWNDGHAVKEKISFIYRALQIRYAPQNADGSLMPAISGKWAMPKTG